MCYELSTAEMGRKETSQLRLNDCDCQTWWIHVEQHSITKLLASKFSYSISCDLKFVSTQFYFCFDNIKNVILNMYHINNNNNISVCEVGTLCWHVWWIFCSNFDNIWIFNHLKNFYLSLFKNFLHFQLSFYFLLSFVFVNNDKLRCINFILFSTFLVFSRPSFSELTVSIGSHQAVGEMMTNHFVWWIKMMSMMRV